VCSSGYLSTKPCVLSQWARPPLRIPGFEFPPAGGFAHAERALREVSAHRVRGYIYQLNRVRCLSGRDHRGGFRVSSFRPLEDSPMLSVRSAKASAHRVGAQASRYPCGVQFVGHDNLNGGGQRVERRWPLLVLLAAHVQIPLTVDIQFRRADGMPLLKGGLLVLTHLACLAQTSRSSARIPFRCADRSPDTSAPVVSTRRSVGQPLCTPRHGMNW